MAISPLTIANLNLADVNATFHYIEERQVSDWPGLLGTLRVGGLAFYSPTLSPALVAANTTAEQTFTVPGLMTTDVVFVNKPTAQAGLGIVGARVSALNTLAITFSNNTGVGITPTATQVYSVVALRSTP